MAAITSSTRTDPVQAETSKTATHHNKPWQKKKKQGNQKTMKKLQFALN